MGEMKMQISGCGGKGEGYSTWKQDALEIFLESSKLDLTYTWLPLTYKAKLTCALKRHLSENKTLTIWIGHEVLLCLNFKGSNITEWTVTSLRRNEASVWGIIRIGHISGPLSKRKWILIEVDKLTAHKRCFSLYKVVQIWPEQTVTCLPQIVPVIFEPPCIIVLSPTPFLASNVPSSGRISVSLNIQRTAHVVHHHLCVDFSVKCVECVMKYVECIVTLIISDDGALEARKRVGITIIIWIEISFRCTEIGLSYLVYDYGSQYIQL